MNRFLFYVLLFLMCGAAQAGHSGPVTAADSPLTWLQPPATDEELKMYADLKDDPSKVRHFIKMRMIFRILGYPTEQEHQNTTRQDGLIQNLKLPGLQASDLDYVFNTDEKILRYRLNLDVNRGSKMTLSDLAKVKLPPPDRSPLAGNAVSQWNQVLSDVGKAAGHSVSWMVCVGGERYFIQNQSPLVFSVEGYLARVKAAGKPESLSNYPVHLDITLPPDADKDYQMVDANGIRFALIDARKVGLEKGKVVQITDGYVDKNLFKLGGRQSCPIINVFKYEPVQ